MARQSEQNGDRYFDMFPTTLRGLLASHPKDGHTTTHKALGKAVGVKQQTISLYASGQTQPTAEVVLRIAQFFDVSLDYLMTGVSSFNKGYSEEFGLSEAAVECLKRARKMCSQADREGSRTLPYLDELLSDRDFYAFLDDLACYVENIKEMETWPEERRKQFEGLNIEGYFIWQLQMFVQEFIRKEIVKLGLNVEME